MEDSAESQAGGGEVQPEGWVQGATSRGVCPSDNLWGPGTSGWGPCPLRVSFRSVEWGWVTSCSLKFLLTSVK